MHNAVTRATKGEGRVGDGTGRMHGTERAIKMNAVRNGVLPCRVIIVIVLRSRYEKYPQMQDSERGVRRRAEEERQEGRWPDRKKSCHAHRSKLISGVLNFIITS